MEVGMDTNYDGHYEEPEEYEHVEHGEEPVYYTGDIIPGDDHHEDEVYDHEAYEEMVGGEVEHEGEEGFNEEEKYDYH